MPAASSSLRMRRLTGCARVVLAVSVLLAGCTLSRPHYVSPDVHVGEPAFMRSIEAHTVSSLIEGNRAQLLLNGEEIFPAMLAAIRGARSTITFANFIYEDGAIAGEMATALAERCRAGVAVNVLLDAVGSGQMPRSTGRSSRTRGARSPGSTRSTPSRSSGSIIATIAGSS
jgi:cardiolipin synthase A/B